MKLKILPSALEDYPPGTSMMICKTAWRGRCSGGRHLICPLNVVWQPLRKMVLSVGLGFEIDPAESLRSSWIVHRDKPIAISFRSN